MFIVVYEFKALAGADATFRAGWAQVTDALRAQRGTFGSRLHTTTDSGYVAYAQWPDEATFDRSAALGAVSGEPGYQMMKDSLAGPVKIAYKLHVIDDRFALR